MCRGRWQALLTKRHTGTLFHRRYPTGAHFQALSRTLTVRAKTPE